MTAPAVPDETDGHVAVVGMAGRFPGARDLAAFAELLATGGDGITRSVEDGRVRAYGAVEGGDLFDAEFFGFSPAEARMLDPQQRVFLECAWEALEHAGHTATDLVGVYAGCGDTDHPMALRANRAEFPGVSSWELRLAGAVDFLTTRAAYTLGLTGPAVTVQTACSTSLVAVHLAVQGLLAGDCDVALAGATAVRVPHPVDDGDDGVVSPDGVCRSFDAAANGTVPADGTGVVVLRRLADALADGDTVHAVVRGTAIGNDGRDKIGFTAPGVSGQAATILAAHRIAGVDPGDVDYVEAHGTATEIGDPIEVRALTTAFGDLPTGSVRLGSVKSVIGHTDTAAGVIGLIAVVLAMGRRELPGTAHFHSPNPLLELGSTPFTVTARATPWPVRERPRRAAVNSVGIGGTNAHVVLEEPPAVAVAPERCGPRLLVLAARDGQALDRSAARLAEHLERDTGTDLDDVARTLATGRRAFGTRGFVVAGTAAAAAAALRAGIPATDASHAPTVGFLFPGHGGQHRGMGRELYRDEPVFRAVVDECAERAAPELGLDLATEFRAGTAEHDTRMRVGQPALFALQVALTELLRHRGIAPRVVVGHSLGSYAAAVAAGVLDRAEALSLVLARGRLLDALPAGAMLAVELSEAELVPMLHGDLSVGAVNGPGQCVLTGPSAQVEQLREQLTQHPRRPDVRRLRISAAAHSRLVDAVLPDYADAVARVTPRPPRIRWISDRTGLEVTPAVALDPGEWVAHLRDTVRFDDAARTLLEPGRAPGVLVELGPGNTLGSLVRRHPAFEAATTTVVPTLPHASTGEGGAVALLEATGRLWAAGVTPRWNLLLHGGRRVPLPTYPFQRRRFRLDGELPTEPMPPPVREDGMSPAERTVAEAFAAVLGVDEVDRQSDFFELGGDSLMAARLLGVVNARLGTELTVKGLFRAPTVAAIAVSAGSPAVPAGTRTGATP